MNKLIDRIKDSASPVKFMALAFFLAGFSFAAHSQSSDCILLSGKITGVQAQANGRKTIRLSPPFYLKNARPRTIVLAADGSFTDTLRTETGQYTLFDKTNLISLYLRKGNSYSIAYDAADYDNKSYVQVGGADTLINRYFIDKFQNRVFVDRSSTAQAEDSFRKFINDKKQTELERLEKSGLSGRLKEEEATYIRYEYLSELYYFLKGKAKEEHSFRPSETSVAELAIDYENEPEYRRQSYYAKLVRLYHENRIYQWLKDSTAKNPSYTPSAHAQHLLRHYQLSVKNEYIKNDLIEQDVRYYLKQSADKGAFYRDFEKYYTGSDTSLREAVLDDYLRFTKLKAGTPSPGFAGYQNVSGGKNSLPDFKGKWVYIDIWATWCLNCWIELPYLKQLEEEYKDKNIVFLGLSVDSHEKKWREAIRKHDMKGVQLLGDINDPFFKEYVVRGIPRYIILDSEGKILDYNAPRPSEKEKLRALFKSAGI